MDNSEEPRRPWRMLARGVLDGDQAIFVEDAPLHGDAAVVKVRGPLRAPDTVRHDASSDPLARRVDAVPAEYTPCVTHPFHGGTATRYASSPEACQRLIDDVHSTSKHHIESSTRITVHAYPFDTNDASQMWCSTQPSEAHSLITTAPSLRACVAALRAHDDTIHTRGVHFDPTTHVCAVGGALDAKLASSSATAPSPEAVFCRLRT